MASSRMRALSSAVGVAAAGSSSNNILIAGVAALVAGTMSMAAGEYVSVSSQADNEQANSNLEQKELAADPEFERCRHRQLGYRNPQ